MSFDTEIEDNIEKKQRKPKAESVVITAEMRKEFWKHDLNPITGFPIPKERTSYQFGEEYSIKGDGVRYADSGGYQSSATR